MSNYIETIRSKVGQQTIILNFSVVCITNGAGEILLQKRSERDDVWGLPGGAIELGESVVEAAVREVKEETGLTVKVPELVGIYSKYFTQYPNGDSAQSICYLFKGEVLAGELKVDQEETFDLKYFSPDKLPTLFTYQHRQMIEDFFAGKTGVLK